jgi:hypothetical protein
MRNLNYRRASERLHLKRRKKIVNSIRDWNLNDEQVKVGMEDPVSWWSNEFWAINQKKRNSRKIRHNNKIELKKLYEE